MIWQPFLQSQILWNNSRRWHCTVNLVQNSIWMITLQWSSLLRLQLRQHCTRSGLSIRKTVPNRLVHVWLTSKTCDNKSTARRSIICLLTASERKCKINAGNSKYRCPLQIHLAGPEVSVGTKVQVDDWNSLGVMVQNLVLTFLHPVTPKLKMSTP